MQKPEPGMPATVILRDGRAHTLRYPLRVLKALKQSHGLDLLKGGTAISEALNDPEQLAIVLHVGLSVEDASITLDWVEDNTDASMLRSIAPMLLYAATGQWVDLDAAAKQPEKNVEASVANGRSHGSTSGLSDATTSGSPIPNSGT